MCSTHIITSSSIFNGVIILGETLGTNLHQSLYLFTFLTTLLLLLAVSCGIVLRSFILRRRFRRRVEAAIAAGVLLPEQVDALRRRGPALGERPTLWEVRIGKGGANAAVGGIHKPGYEYPAATGDNADDAHDDWAHVMVCHGFDGAHVRARHRPSKY